jgi:hypothetical protein
MADKGVIKSALNKAKQEEKHHLVTDRELKEQDKEFSKEAKGLRKLLSKKFWKPYRKPHKKK